MQLPWLSTLCGDPWRATHHYRNDDHTGIVHASANAWPFPRDEIRVSYNQASKARRIFVGLANCWTYIFLIWLYCRRVCLPVGWDLEICSFLWMGLWLLEETWQHGGHCFGKHGSGLWSSHSSFAFSMCSQTMLLKFTR
jgi:hypothetical protein